MAQLNTMQITNSGQIILTSVEDKSQTTIETNHPKHGWFVKNEGRIIKNNNGKFTSMKDYWGHYNKPTVSKPAQPIKVNLTKLDDLNIDDSLFNSMETGTVFDKVLSTDGGFMPGTNIMAAGAPGVGKTTVLLEMLAKLHEVGKKVLFISAEMAQIDMARYLKRFPNWGQLPILFLSDYVEECPQTVIEHVLSQGWDVVLTDSYTEVNDTVKEACNLTRSKTEKWFLDLMIHHNGAKNKAKKYTCFVTILQLSKGGQFVGSNKLKHMTTSMMHLDWEGGENGRRFLEFSKNRVGAVNKKLYFNIQNGVEFDEARYARELFNDSLVEQERKQLETEADAFDKLFGFGDLVAEAAAGTEIEVEESVEA
jgi:predicted ATP-dependent serine protease